APASSTVLKRLTLSVDPGVRAHGAQGRRLYSGRELKRCSKRAATWGLHAVPPPSVQVARPFRTPGDQRTASARELRRRRKKEHMFTRRGLLAGGSLAAAALLGGCGLRPTGGRTVASGPIAT